MQQGGEVGGAEGTGPAWGNRGSGWEAGEIMVKPGGIAGVWVGDIWGRAWITGKVQ